METDAEVKLDACVIAINRSRFGQARYRGFDGRYEDDLTEVSGWDRMHSEVAALDDPVLDIVLVARPDLVPALLADGWTLLGWDVGYLKTMYAHFSIVCHAVLALHLETLRAFEPQLNAVGLAPDMVTAQAIAEAYRQAGDAGRNVEQCDVIDVLAVLDRPPVAL